jgi:hypothetical protein
MVSSLIALDEPSPKMRPSPGTRSSRDALTLDNSRARENLVPGLMSVPREERASADKARQGLVSKFR